MGGQVALAAAICRVKPGSRVGQGHVWKWLNALKGETPPPEYVITIAEVTDWQVTPHQLRDDIYPHPLDGMPRIEQQEAA